MSEKHRFDLSSYPLPKNAQGKTYYDKTPGYVRLGRAFRQLIDEPGLDDPRDALERPFGAIHAGSTIQFVDIETHCFNHDLVTSLADRGDYSSYVGQPRKPDLGSLRREIDRGRSNPWCTANRLLDSRHAGGTGHAFDTEAHRGGMFRVGWERRHP